jgi:hypothetical protein
MKMASTVKSRGAGGWATRGWATDMMDGRGDEKLCACSEQTCSFSLHLPSHYENGGANFLKSGTSNGLRRFDDN